MKRMYVSPNCGTLPAFGLSLGRPAAQITADATHDEISALTNHVEDGLANPAGMADQ
jgi:hypothetical protein